MSVNWALESQGSRLNLLKIPRGAQIRRLTHLHELPAILVFHLVFCRCRQQNLI